MTAPQFHYYVEIQEDEQWRLGNHRIKTLRSVTAEGCPMPDAYLNGRPVYFGDIDYRGVDSFMHGCCYADTLEDLDDNEHEELQEQCADYLCTQVSEHYGYYPK
jgi:hypothetical protein